MRRAVGLVMAGLVLAGCAEMRTPRPASRIPPVLASASLDPVRDAVAEAAALFADGGRSLAGQPARMARAAALLELVTAEVPRDLRFQPIVTPTGLELRAARIELRAALGTRAGADPEAVVRALAAAHAALARGDRAAAEAALSPSLFEPGGAGTLARIGNPGPLPQSRNATALTEEAMRGLERDRLGGLTNALDPNAGILTPGAGIGMGGMGLR